MGWCAYDEPEPKESSVSEFLIGVYLDTPGVYGGGWALISPGWVSPGAILIDCTDIGLLLCGKLAYDSARRKNKARLEELSIMHRC